MAEQTSLAPDGVAAQAGNWSLGWWQAQGVVWGEGETNSSFASVYCCGKVWFDLLPDSPDLWRLILPWLHDISRAANQPTSQPANPITALTEWKPTFITNLQFIPSSCRPFANEGQDGLDKETRRPGDLQTVNVWTQKAPGHGLGLGPLGWRDGWTN